MKHPNAKYRRWQSQWRSRLICVSAALLFLVLSAQSQTAIFPPIGGSGGGQFIARCPQGQLLTGFELRTGDDVDAIRPICVPAYGPADIGPLRPYPSKFGGDGGAPRQLLCPTDQPIVTGIYVLAEGVDTVIVNSIHLFCGLAATTQTPGDLPSAVFDAPPYKPSDGFLGINVNRDWGLRVRDTQRCPAGLVGVGINGRSGVWLDAVGLICGPPKLTPDPKPPVKAIGRVSSSTTSGPERPICELAREARARNSPAAPGLEAQCRAAGAAGETPPVKAIGRVKVSEPTGASPRPICEAAREARARNSPAAPGLEAQCRAAGAAGEAPVDLNELAAKGEAIANQDPLAVELRNRQPEGPARRGFDIGMAAAEGQTSLGPVKQKIHDSLSPEEQGGFDTAVAFSLERNRNADLAAKGAAIAAADPVVTEARTAEADVFYWLGFDIATGIFGDPALGALGNTATGPGSLKIRDSLSAAGRRGFNAAVKLHLSRNYKP